MLTRRYRKTIALKDKEVIKQEKKYCFVVEAALAHRRLDAFLAARPEISSRSAAQKLISNGYVLVNGKSTNKHYHLKEKDVVSFTIPPLKKMEVSPEKIPLKIIYEDDDLLVVSKPAGMVTHPAHGHQSKTLVNALLAHTKALSDTGGEERLGIIHRLDKDTSGLLIVAKNNEAHVKLAEAIKKREVERTYLALVNGVVKDDAGIVDVPIGRSFKDPTKMRVEGRGSRDSITHFKALERFDNYTLLEISLKTGRTHQIRVHMNYLRHPVAGDKEYSFRKTKDELKLDRQFLHAYKLKFAHPRTGKLLELEDKLADDLQKTLNELKKQA